MYFFIMLDGTLMYFFIVLHGTLMYFIVLDGTLVNFFIVLDGTLMYFFIVLDGTLMNFFIVLGWKANIFFHSAGWNASIFFHSAGWNANIFFHSAGWNASIFFHSAGWNANIFFFHFALYIFFHFALYILLNYSTSLYKFKNQTSVLNLFYFIWKYIITFLLLHDCAHCGTPTKFTKEIMCQQHVKLEVKGTIITPTYKQCHHSSFTHIWEVENTIKNVYLFILFHFPAIYLYSQNAVVMMDMQDTIQELQREMAALGASPSKLPSTFSRVSSATESSVDPSIIFSRLDAERNQKALKRGLNSQKVGIYHRIKWCVAESKISCLPKPYVVWSSKISLKSVKFSFFFFLTNRMHHFHSYILQKTPLKLVNWFQRYEQLKDAKNNRKQKIFSALFDSILKSIFLSSDWFCLITSHMWCDLGKLATWWKCNILIFSIM